MLRLGIAHPKLEMSDADAYVPDATRHRIRCINTSVMKESMVCVFGIELA
jgi:hypothetical protein